MLDVSGHACLCVYVNVPSNRRGEDSNLACDPLKRITQAMLKRDDFGVSK